LLTYELLPLYIYLFIVTFVAYAIKGITGFGNTLVMSPLYAFYMSNRIITPVDLLFSLPTNAILVWKNRTRLNIKRILPLAGLLLIGVIPGTLILKSSQDSVLKIFLGITVIGLGFEIFLRKEVYAGAKSANPLILTGAGLLSGILAGLYGITAPLVAYISRTSDGREEFRANLCALFLIDNLFRLFYYIILGLFNYDVLLIVAIALPAAIGGIFAGSHLDKFISDQKAKLLMVFILVLSGIVLIVRNI
jgi:uncharacterized protein